jgi:hypothetical protein
MRRMFEWAEHPILCGSTAAHKCAAIAAEAADEWLGLPRKPRGVVIVRVKRQAFGLVEALFFQHIDLLRSKDLAVRIFRSQWGYAPLIEVTAKCGATLRVE